jgi:hypothetical protein
MVEHTIISYVIIVIIVGDLRVSTARAVTVRSNVNDSAKAIAGETIHSPVL